MKKNIMEILRVGRLYSEVMQPAVLHQELC